MYSHKYKAQYYHDPKTGLWWGKDTASHGGKWQEGGAIKHDGSAWKVFKETGKGLEWYKDADKYGQFITGKHKSNFGIFIPWKELRGIHINKG